MLRILAAGDMAHFNAFISYRREDSAGYAGRLYDRLTARFPGRIFMDVSDLVPGADFVEAIEKSLARCRALIVLIGKYWSVSIDGSARLQDPRDFVHLEVAHALKRKIRVIPVLVRGALLPSIDTLPDEIRPLLYRQALSLEDASFDFTVSKLVEVLQNDLGPAVAVENRSPSLPPVPISVTISYERDNIVLQGETKVFIGSNPPIGLQIDAGKPFDTVQVRLPQSGSYSYRLEALEMHSVRDSGGQPVAIPAQLSSNGTLEVNSGDALQIRHVFVARKGFQVELGPVERIGQTKDCPYCGRPLRTAKAKQCRFCGRNWHNATDADALH